MTSAILIKGEGTYPTPEVRKIYPSRRLLWKYYFLLLLIWVAFILVFLVVILIVTSIPGLQSAQELRNFFILLIIAFTLPIFIPLFVLLPFYIRSMEFLVHGDEIIVKKGLINRTIKYVPYRTVTNLSTTAGPFDRLFKIGNIGIETAGRGGSLDAEPEEKLEGLFLYQEIRDYILKRLRVFQSLQRGEKDAIELSTDVQTLQEESLATLNAIKELLEVKFGE